MLPSWLLACSGPDKTPDHSGDAPGAWQVVAEGLPAALLTVTGGGADDVWAAGADAGDGPLVVRWGGAAWETHDVGSPGDLWWAWRAGPDAVWFAGAGGRIVRYTPSEGTSVVDVTDPEATLFGLWGTAEDDVWAVGGALGRPNGAEVWHFDGEAWSAVALPPDAAAQGSMYKVWGSSADDVWVCGLGGVVLRWDGSAWTSMSTGVTEPLFTVSGSGPDDVWAVGGAGNGVALRWDGATWTDHAPDFTETLQGVDARGEGVEVVGWSGKVLRGDASGLAEDPLGRVGDFDVHSVWVDPDGGRWLVGGDLAGATLGDGAIGYDGPADVATVPR